MAQPADPGHLQPGNKPEAVIALSSEGKVLHWSRGAQAMFGYSSDEIVGRSVESLAIPAELVAWERQMLRQAFEAGFADYASQRRAKDGTLRNVDVVRRSVSDADGTFRFVVSIEKLSRSTVVS